MSDSAKPKIERYFNEAGRPIGETHHNAVLTEQQVALLLQLRDEGWTLRRLAEAFEISLSSAAAICRGDVRSQTIARVE